MVNFEAMFDIGEKVRHTRTMEKFFVRFVTFGPSGIPVYSCHSIHTVGRGPDAFNFDEAELELIEGV